MYFESKELSLKQKTQRVITMSKEINSTLDIYRSIMVKYELNKKLEKEDLALLEETIERFDRSQLKLEDVLFGVLEQHRFLGGNND
jgi:hypothetical protein|nr:Hypothetical protein PLANC_42 [Enterococcus phage Planchet]